jgi:hypothetical protein
MVPLTLTRKANHDSRPAPFAGRWRPPSMVSDPSRCDAGGAHVHPGPALAFAALGDVRGGFLDLDSGPFGPQHHPSPGAIVPPEDRNSPRNQVKA